MSDFDNVPASQPGSATPTPAPTPAPSDTGAPSSPQSTTPTAPQPGATQPGGNEAFVPSYRLREVREAYERRLSEELGREKAAWQAEKEAYEKKVRALAGVLPAEVTQQDQITEQYYKLFPHHKGLTPEKLEQLDKMLERQAALEAENEMRWQSHGHQQLNHLYKLGTDAGLPDSEQTRNALHSALVGYLSVNPQEQNRFAVDPNFIPEFFKAYAATMIDPFRRSQVAAIQGRTVPALPQDSPSGAVPVTTQMPKPKDLDERANLSWTAFQQSKNGR